MGYELRMYVVRKNGPIDELEEDKKGRAKKDDKGRYIKTGRQEVWLHQYAMVDLCKLDSASATSRLAHEAKTAFTRDTAKHLVFTISQGDETVKEDLYGDPLVAIPVKEALDALRTDAAQDEYRRFRWARDLLAALAEDSEPLFVVFFGH